VAQPKILFGGVRVTRKSARGKCNLGLILKTHGKKQRIHLKFWGGGGITIPIPPLVAPLHLYANKFKKYVIIRSFWPKYAS